MSERQRPDRFDGDAHPGAAADYCPLCGYAAPAGTFAHAGEACPSCGGTFDRMRPERRPPYAPDHRRGAVTWS